MQPDKKVAPGLVEEPGFGVYARSRAGVFDLGDADTLLATELAPDWLDDVRSADEDRFLALSDHLPRESAEALFRLAAGEPVAPPAPELTVVPADPFEHPDAQEAIRWCEHMVLIYPLWLGTMPALVKGFLEQVFRPSLWAGMEGGRWRPHLIGRSARVVVTMGMPALAYRWYFGAHSLKSLERNVLRFSGIRPVRHSLIGGVETRRRAHRERWLARMEGLGRSCR